jgi:hypothetical protein
LARWFLVPHGKCRRLPTADAAAIMPTMLKATLKWALILASLLALGPLVSRLMMNVRDVDGGRAVTFLVNGDLGAAMLTLGALVGCMLLVGVIAAKLFGWGTAVMCAGFIAAWTATGQGTLESIVRRAGGGGDLFKLGVEGLLLTVLAGLGAVLFGRVAAGPAGGASALPANHARARLSLLTEGDTSRDNPMPVILAGIGAGFIVAVIVVWLFALSGARNQTLASAIIAGMAAGGVNHAISAGRSFTLSVLVPILSLALLAMLAPVLVKFVEGPRLLAKVYDGTVLNLARPVSLDWVAGALIGVPLGMSWANTSAKPAPR